MIHENVAAIRGQIAASAKKSGRDPNDIKLIGVTKTIDVSRIKELLVAGVGDIGENRVQEFLPKYEILKPEKPIWHFIGHLQRNKVKFIADKVDLIHSVDSMALAEEIDRQAKKFNRVINILLEVNIAGEISKFGIPPCEILESAKNLVKLPNVRLSGLMCVAPFVENAEENRRFFEKMRNLRLDIQRNCIYYTNRLELSMGMTCDYSVAIEEDATMIRIGTALFGSRM
ncbi:MAG: YggS family pyridoxal phosphate-dependent enzyme [Defluviitaleaceae bacterium]|nr:YggS family pyridoxal phosphate-dependent enzyme [Defluviitaleaceae bacterium]